MSALRRRTALVAAITQDRKAVEIKLRRERNKFKAALRKARDPHSWVCDYNNGSLVDNCSCGVEKLLQEGGES